VPTKSIKKISLVGAGNVFNAGLGFLFLTAVARTLDLETFGKYALLSTLLLTLSKIVDFGANSVFVARSITEQNNKLSDTLFTLKILQFIITIPISLVCLKLLNVFTPTIALIFILGTGAYTMNYLFYAYFQRAEKYSEMILLNTIPQLIKAAVAVALFANIFPATLDLSFGVFSLTILAGALLYFRLPSENKRPHIDPTGLAILFKEALPAGTSQIVYESWGTLNNAIAKFAKGFSDVGILSLANKISNIFSLVSLSIFAVLLPKNATRKLTGKRYDYAETLLISLGIIALAALSVFASEIFVIRVFGEKFAGSVGLLDILIIAAAISSIHTFLENFFFVESKTNYIIISTGIKLASYGCAVALLLPVYDLYGIAWANLVSAITGLATTLYFVSLFKAERTA